MTADATIHVLGDDRSIRDWLSLLFTTEGYQIRIHNPLDLILDTNILHRKDSVARLRTIILVALLALVRKFIITDVASLDPLAVFGLACAASALGLVYWLVGEQDRRDAANELNSTATR